MNRTHPAAPSRNRRLDYRRRPRTTVRIARMAAVLVAWCATAVSGEAREADDPAAAAEQAREASRSLRILAYNIHHGAGTDEKLDLERIAALIVRERADLVALQEVDRKCGRSDRVDQAAELGRLTGLHHAFGAFMNYDGGEYGLAVLSRFPVEESFNHRLPPGGEPRSALEIRVRIPRGHAEKGEEEGECASGPGEGTLLSFVSVHLDWINDDRRRFEQAQALRDRFKSVEHPILVAGDFNDVPGSRTIALLDEAWTRMPKTGDRLTWPSETPKVEIDYVFAKNFAPGSDARCRVIDEKVASDHRPVLAEIPLPFGKSLPGPEAAGASDR